VSQADLTVQGHGQALSVGPVFAIPTKKLAMWLFIIADTMTFSACLVAYGFVRNGSATWPRPFHSITNVAIMTFVLLTSSLTMLIGLRAAQKGDKARAFTWIMVTALLGVVFALLHIREWMGLIGDGVRPFHNPWGSPLFGATFFSITGLHLLHVVSGVIALIVIWRGYTRGALTAGHVETTGLYWHFVDLVWMFVVPAIYLLSIQR
jgi:cytochrome c oxidase subunit 3